jgi:prolipoprotein diacylglyceryltransferase
MEFSLLAAALLGVAMALAVLRLERVRGVTDRRDLVDLVIGAAVVGLAVGRVAAMILQGTNPLTHPLDLFFIRGGVDTGFASLGSLVFLSWTTRHDFWPTLDMVAPAALSGLAGWHAGCMFRSSCAGTVSTLPWALHDGAFARHPVELYAALLLLGGAAVLVVWRRRLPLGVTASLALTIAAVVRLATEPLRLGLGSSPVPWYAAGVAIGVAGVVIRVISARSRNITDS